MAESTEEAYLEFLDRCENGSGIAYADDLKLLMQQEKIIRPSAEIDGLMAASNATGDALLEQTLRSQQDYIVDFQAIKESPPERGPRIEDVSVDKAIIEVLKSKRINYLYKFQEEAIEKILQGEDVVITAPTASGKTEAFCNKLQKNNNNCCALARFVVVLKVLYQQFLFIQQKHYHVINCLR
jgi:DEAD/DEAH box helicase domain-containing protein